MGFFDFLFGGKQRTNAQVRPDCVWMSEDAKFTGIETELSELIPSEPAAIFLVAQFPDVLSRLESLANSSTSTSPVQAVLAEDLLSNLIEPLQLNESSVIDFIVAERHPMLSVDEEVVAFASYVPCPCRYSFHVSLEDPVLRVFAADSIRDLLSKLGMSETDCIESAMVSRRIQQAQRKIEGRVATAVKAKSGDDWLEKNCPELASE